MTTGARRTLPTLIVPGWEGSGRGHWQTWLEGELHAIGRATLRPDFANLDQPELHDWRAGLLRALESLPDEGFDVVAHSLGAVLWLHHVTETLAAPRPVRVVLVAPPSPSTTIAEVAAFFPPPLDHEAVRRAAGSTVMVAGDDDPYLPEGVDAAYGLPLRLTTTVVPAGGHLSPKSGFGPWPAMRDWCLSEDLAFTR